MNWLGGDLTVTLTNLVAGVDNDLFIYRPSDLNSSGDYSALGGTFPDAVTIPAALPGMYYINVDSTFFSEGSYQLAITPSPSSGLILGSGMMFAARRRRR